MKKETAATNAQRQLTVREWEKEKREAGWKLVRVWLPPDSMKKLDALAEKCGGRGKAIEELLR